MSTSGQGAVHIAQMAEAHLDEVVAIERSSAPHPWSRGIFVDELAAADQRVYVVAVDEKDVVVGFCGVLLVPAAGEVGEAHVTNVATAAAARRQGIARAMLVHTLETARLRGASAATLEVRVSNLAARSLYQSLGFGPVGVRPRYYDDNGEDALILWKHDL